MEFFKKHPYFRYNFPLPRCSLKSNDVAKSNREVFFAPRQCIRNFGTKFVTIAGNEKSFSDDSEKFFSPSSDFPTDEKTSFFALSDNIP
jgi:hypothetical protein